jgi:hypothetical protein
LGSEEGKGVRKWTLYEQRKKVSKMSIVFVAYDRNVDSNGGRGTVERRFFNTGRAILGPYIDVSE